jgi:hypothetical protein
MSWMVEVYYKEPSDVAREELLTRKVAEYGGSLTYREVPSEEDISRSIILTYEFEIGSQATLAADQLRSLGEHVEGPCNY